LATVLRQAADSEAEESKACILSTKETMRRERQVYGVDLLRYLLTNCSIEGE
jgi:hypothetical protein